MLKFNHRTAWECDDCDVIPGNVCAHDLGRGGRGLGEYIAEKAILFISDNILSEKYWEHWNKQYDKGLL